MKLRVLRADPAGNITMFVLDPVHRAERAALAAKLMRMPGLGVDQVAFVCAPKCGGDGRFEMMGGEFCGNATRAFGLFLAQTAGITGTAHYAIETSGCEGLVGVDVDVERGTASADMPLPKRFGKVSVDELEGVAVDLGGIVHFVVEQTPDEAVMEKIGEIFNAPRERGGFADAEAYGVIFLHDGTLTPLIRVPATGTLTWEGSCGSGSLAAAIAEGLDLTKCPVDGSFAKDYIQPAGTVRAEIAWKQYIVQSAAIGGAVKLGKAVLIDVD